MLSKKTKGVLRKAGQKEMSEIWRTALPHALCNTEEELWYRPASKFM
jgi:hypothetical protein